ncbi:type II secretion system protein J [Desulfopila sp. IMCC35008]|uniref:PulJ/GspJ family protein n=1 Tax=Desulfopila sp. IMCC35008 TaxID=2653858 RepID=UPI0013D58B33|nr:prepilin-type N-terminal cleavage/methylation domain-containing protein [Desulfopila sp. IMCC35008]
MADTHDSNKVRVMSSAGFTLLELLLAIFVFSVVITTVFGAYRTTFHNVQKSEFQAKMEGQARIILERIEADLESTFAGDGGIMDGEQEDVDGKRGDRLSFTSTAHLRFNRNDQYAGVTVITYSTVENEESGLLSLYRLDNPLTPVEEEQADEEEQGELLGENLKEFKLTYLNSEGDEQDNWQGNDNEASDNQEEKQLQLPVVIKVELRFGNPMDEEESRLFRTAVAILPGRLSGNDKK